MDFHLINVQGLRVFSALLSPLLPVEGSLDLLKDAAPQKPNIFIHVKNRNGHNQHGKILIWQPFSWSLSYLLQHWLRTGLKCGPAILHVGVLWKEGWTNVPVVENQILTTSFYGQVRAFFAEDHFFPTQYF